MPTCSYPLLTPAFGVPACLQVLDAALTLLLALSGSDPAALLACCQLGFIPAVLRFASPSTPLDLRMQASTWLRLWLRCRPFLSGMPLLLLQQDAARPCWCSSAHPCTPHAPRSFLPCAAQAAAFAEVLCRSSAASAQQVVACQGVPFLRWGAISAVQCS